MDKQVMDLKSKLPHTGTTIFTMMSKLANENNAINLSQGFPDFDVDSQLIELVHLYMKKGYNQYAPMQGILQLRQAISDKIYNCYNTEYNPDTEITITAGATQAIFTAISAVVNKGDEVLIFEPAYDCYSPAVELNGGVPVYLQLELPQFKINWEAVNKKINSKTRLIIINNPNNPAGSILSESDLKNLISVTSGKEIYILSDEVYEHIVFDDHLHCSVSAFPELAQKSFVVFSFGKTFHATGWKMGYCIAPEFLMKEFRKVHQFNVFSVNTPIQYAITGFLNDENNYLKLKKLYSDKRNLFVESMKQSKFRMLQCDGTYFQIVDYSNISNEPDYEFALRLIKEYGVASVPVSAFYKDKFNGKLLRFCFAKKDETIISAAEKLKKIK